MISDEPLERDVMLSEETLRKVHAAAISANCERDSLLSGIDVRFAASLPTARSLAAQLWSDLNILNKTPRLTGGVVPLVQWLSAAQILVEPRVESLVFEAALGEIRGDSASAGAKESHASQSGSEAAASPFGEGSGVRCFVSFHHEDSSTLSRLETHLALLRRGGELRLWHRGKALPGQVVDHMVASAADQAELILVLVSSDYLGDDALADELAVIMKRHARGEARVIPIVTRPCDWSSAPLSVFQALPRDGRPIETQKNADEAFTEIVRAIRQVLGDARSGTK